MLSRFTRRLWCTTKSLLVHEKAPQSSCSFFRSSDQRYLSYNWEHYQWAFCFLRWHAGIFGEPHRAASAFFSLTNHLTEPEFQYLNIGGKIIRISSVKRMDKTRWKWWWQSKTVARWWEVHCTSGTRGCKKSLCWNRGVGNLRLIRLIGLGPASRVFTCSLLDRLLYSFNPIYYMPHMTSYSNRLWARVSANRLGCCSVFSDYDKLTATMSIVVVVVINWNLLRDKVNRRNKCRTAKPLRDRAN